MQHPIGHLSLLLRKTKTLTDAQHLLEEQVRAAPEDAGLRWVLAQWCCLQEDWPRALKLAQTTAKLQPSYVQSAQVLRALVQAQQQRAQVFAGKQVAGQVLPWMPWVEQLAQALQQHSQGETNKADALRLAALEQVPPWCGQTPVGSCTWIADSDSRLGPVCELIAAGSYRWLPWADIVKLETLQPTTLLDLMWLPAQVTLKASAVGDKPVSAYIPTRYPGTLPYIQQNACPESLRLSLLLGCETLWQDSSETAVCGIGQKTWISDAGDFSLFESKILTSSSISEDTPSEPTHAG